MTLEVVVGVLLFGLGLLFPVRAVWRTRRALAEAVKELEAHRGAQALHWHELPEPEAPTVDRMEPTAQAPVVSRKTLIQLKPEHYLAVPVGVPFGDEPVRFARKHKPAEAPPTPLALAPHNPLGWSSRSRRRLRRYKQRAARVRLVLVLGAVFLVGVPLQLAWR